MTPIPVTRSVLDRERVCERCRKKAASVIFDQAIVCAGCARWLDQALARERGTDVRVQQSRNGSR